MKIDLMDPVPFISEIEEDFIPELLDDVSEELNRERAYRLVVDSIIREVRFIDH